MNEEKNNKSEPQKEQAEKPKLNEEQYKLLLSCSEKKDITAWNKYRKEHPDEEIWLQGADLRKFKLQDAHLSEANLQSANLDMANLQSANLDMANLQSANLQGANLQDAFISLTNLIGADLIQANLQGAYLAGADLQGAKLREANLAGTNFEIAVVDGGTLIWKCKINRYTNFEGVGLDSAQIDSATKQLLEYNIRRKNWEEWYKSESKNKWIIKMRRLTTFPIRLFWWISNYGISTVRIILLFFLCSFMFTSIYYIWGMIASPGIVDNLFVDKNGIAIESWIVPFRTMYFSTVTMTTLGFGDIYTNAHSVCGHILISLQVILGYFLLGALVTRLAVLFTAGGPAGKFAKMNNEKAVEPR